MPYGRDRRKREEGETIALDPIATTLAIWLGLVVSITALGRLAQDAQAQAALRNESAPLTAHIGQPALFTPLGS